MHHFSMKKSGFIRYSALVILWVSMSTSSIVSAECLEWSATIDGECIETDDGALSATNEYIPLVYSGAAITLGAHSNVFGDIQSVAAVTLGEVAEVGGSILAGAAVTVEKDGEVAGDVTAGEAATLGDSASVFGGLAARAEVFIGAHSQISGDLTSNRGIKLGVGAKVFGTTTAANSVTLGAHAKAGNDGLAISIRTMRGPIILGAHAKVKGDAKAGSIISMGMHAKVMGVETQHAVPEDFANRAESPVVNKTDELTQKQKQLSDTGVEPYTELTTSIDTSRAFYPGTYHASALTVTAGTNLTFIGSGLDKSDEWLINIDTYLSFGANVTIDLVDVAEGSTIIFNTGTYATIGANSIFRGTILAGTYITTGANTTLAGVGSDCGGLFAISGAITIGAHSTVGAADCWQTLQQYEDHAESAAFASYEYYDEYSSDEYYSDEYYSDEYYGDEYYDDEYYDDEYYDDGYYDDGYYDDGYYDDRYYDDGYYDDGYYDDGYYDDGYSNDEYDDDD